MNSRNIAFRGLLILKCAGARVKAERIIHDAGDVTGFNEFTIRSSVNVPSVSCPNGSNEMRWRAGAGDPLIIYTVRAKPFVKLS